MSKCKNHKYRDLIAGIGLFVGACLGALIGYIATGNGGTWSGVGLLFGVSVGTLVGDHIDKRKAKNI